MSYENKKQLQIEEVLKTINLWEKKVMFSLNSFFVFLMFLLIYSIDPIFGYLPSIVFGLFFLFFTQQLIRSYNYLKFHRVTLKSLQIIHKIIDKKKGS